MTSEKGTRINKYLSEIGYCSRRKADELIAQGRVSVNGEIPEMGVKITEKDSLLVDGKPIVAKKKENTYIAFNKPMGIVCTTNPVEKDNIIDFIKYPTRIFPIGRLDKSSEGLILLTDDGEIVNKILRSRNNHGKEYIVRINRPVNPQFIARMSNGVPILDTVTKKCEVTPVSKYIFRIVLTQGLNRQIRRMCEALEYEVVALKRIRVLNIHLDIPVGTYRDLTEEELKNLNLLLKSSDKTEEGSIQNEKQVPSKKPLTIKNTSRESNKPQQSREKQKQQFRKKKS